jgi:hypothetical protein
MTTKILINNQVYSTETHYCPPYHNHGRKDNAITLRINITNETIYCGRREFNNYDELYNFLKEKDISQGWFKHYHNFLGDEDGTYLDNMLNNVRRRYKIFLSKYDFSQN